MDAREETAADTFLRDAGIVAPSLASCPLGLMGTITIMLGLCQLTKPHDGVKSEKEYALKLVMVNDDGRCDYQTCSWLKSWLHAM